MHNFPAQISKSRVPVRSQTAVRQTRIAQSPVAAYIRGEPPATAASLGKRFWESRSWRYKYSSCIYCDVNGDTVNEKCLCGYLIRMLVPYTEYGYYNYIINILTHNQCPAVRFIGVIHFLI